MQTQQIFEATTYRYVSWQLLFFKQSSLNFFVFLQTLQPGNLMKYSGVLPVGKEHTPQIFDHENMSQNWLVHHKVGPYQLYEWGFIYPL